MLQNKICVFKYIILSKLQLDFSFIAIERKGFLLDDCIIISSGIVFPFLCFKQTKNLESSSLFVFSNDGNPVSNCQFNNMLELDYYLADELCHVKKRLKRAFILVHRGQFEHCLHHKKVHITTFPVPHLSCRRMPDFCKLKWINTDQVIG